jgi:hypothetical protein
MMPNDPHNDWQVLWDVRLVALESVFGPHDDDAILHSPIPFNLDGNADVLIFRKHLKGVVYVTADLIGDDRSKPSELGQYELMICLRREADWAPDLIAWLARYTIEAVLSPGDTMEIAPGLPQPTRLTNLLFVPYAELTVNRAKAGVLLCLGITSDEFDYCVERGSDAMLGKLKQANVYPFTDLSRRSVELDS